MVVKFSTCFFSLALFLCSTSAFLGTKSERLVATSPGSKPPSCVNKCDNCTPCQAVQTVQDASDTLVTDIGSKPPSCQNKCNRCIPCEAIQVPTPDPKKTDNKPVQPQGEVNTHYSNYKPKGWRCQCGNKLFNP